MSDYQPKSILITGGAGFIGSWFTNLIVREKVCETVVVIDKLDYCSRLNNILPDVMEKIKFIKGDILNKDLLNHILNEYNIDTVVHFAASTHVDNSFDVSLDFTVNNILGTHTLIDCCRKFQIRRFVHISTDEVYGEIDLNSPIGYNEIQSFEPTNPYAATKAGAEHIVKSYFHSYKFPAVIVRANNTYGPGQFPEKLIPKFSVLLFQNKKLTIHGQGVSRRNFIYVDDTCRAVLVILKRGIDGESYNIGTDNEYNVIEIASKLIKSIHPGIEMDSLLEYVPDRIFNDKRYFLDSTKLRKLGWDGEKTSFDEGLETTIQWYKERLDEYSSLY